VYYNQGKLSTDMIGGQTKQLIGPRRVYTITARLPQGDAGQAEYLIAH
jgi:hypothetical protein